MKSEHLYAASVNTARGFILKFLAEIVLFTLSYLTPLRNTQGVRSTDVLMSENMIKERKESTTLPGIQAVCNGLTFVAKVSFLPVSV